MVKTHELSVIKRAEIIGAYKCDVKPAEISRKLGIPDTTVRNIIKSLIVKIQLRISKEVDVPVYFQKKTFVL